MDTRNRQMNPTQPYIFIHCVDEEGITAVPAALTFADIEFKTSELHYVSGDDRVTINRHGAGIYEITLSACIEKDTGAPTHSVFEIYVNGAALDCAEAHGIVGTAGQHSSVFLKYTIYLDVGDYVQVYASVDAGTGTLETNTGRFMMKGVTMEGWNNRRAGGTIYPFRQE